MMKTNTISKLVMTVILLSGGLFASIATAQTTVNNTVFDARLLNHYSVEELTSMKTDHPDIYTEIEYYYTQSYVLEIMTDCFDCPPPPDPATFDISKWEHLRYSDDIKIFKNFKEGYVLNLIPIKKLTYKTPVQIARLQYQGQH